MDLEIFKRAPSDQTNSAGLYDFETQTSETGLPGTITEETHSSKMHGCCSACGTNGFKFFIRIHDKLLCKVCHGNRHLYPDSRPRHVLKELTTNNHVLITDGIPQDLLKILESEAEAMDKKDFDDESVWLKMRTQPDGTQRMSVVKDATFSEEITELMQCYMQRIQSPCPVKKLTWLKKVPGGEDMLGHTDHRKEGAFAAMLLLGPRSFVP